MIARALIKLIRLYKRIVSPFLPGRCRFHPTCSDFAAEAISTHGVVRGLALAARRLLRCHPLHEGGFDPVPVPREEFLLQVDWKTKIQTESNPLSRQAAAGSAPPGDAGASTN